MRSGFQASLLLLLFGCTSPQERGPFNDMQKIDRFAYDGPLFVAGNKTEVELRSLGKIVKDKSTEEKNIYDGTPLFVKQLVFEGLEINFRIFGTPAKVQLTSILITSPLWSIKDHLDVGTPLKAVIARLGSPSKQTNNSIEYQGETERIVFDVSDNKVRSVLFDYYYE